MTSPKFGFALQTCGISTLKQAELTTRNVDLTCNQQVDTNFRNLDLPQTKLGYMKQHTGEVTFNKRWWFPLDRSQPTEKHEGEPYRERPDKLKMLVDFGV